MKLINIEKIKEAREKLNGIIAYNRLAFAPRLSKIANAKVFLKKENL